MSVAITPEKRTTLNLSLLGLMIMAAAVAAVSVRDPGGLPLRVGMIVLTVGAVVALPWQGWLTAAIAIWLGSNYLYSSLDSAGLFDTSMLLELPGLVGVAGFAGLSRLAFDRLEAESDGGIGAAAVGTATNDRVSQADLGLQPDSDQRLGDRQAPAVRAAVVTPSPAAPLSKHRPLYPEATESLEELLARLEETLLRRRLERLNRAA